MINCNGYDDIASVHYCLQIIYYCSNDIVVVLVIGDCSIGSTHAIGIIIDCLVYQPLTCSPGLPSFDIDMRCHHFACMLGYCAVIIGGMVLMIIIHCRREESSTIDDNDRIAERRR